MKAEDFWEKAATVALYGLAAYLLVKHPKGCGCLLLLFLSLFLIKPFLQLIHVLVE